MIPIYPARCLCVRRQLPLPSSYKFPFWTSRSTTETVEMSSSPWRNFRHWLHRKWPKWQPSVQPVAKNSSTCRHFRASDRTTSPFVPKSGEMCCVSSSLHRDVHTYFPLKTIIRLQNYQNKIKLQLSVKEACRWTRYWLFLIQCEQPFRPWCSNVGLSDTRNNQTDFRCGWHETGCFSFESYRDDSILSALLFLCGEFTVNRGPVVQNCDGVLLR